MQYEKYTRSARAEFGTRGMSRREVGSQFGFSQFCGGRRAFVFCRSRRKETLILGLSSSSSSSLVLDLLSTHSTTMRKRTRTKSGSRMSDSLPRYALSLTPRFSGVIMRLGAVNRFNRFHTARPNHRKTAEAVQNLLSSVCTPLKRGVNERSACSAVI